MDAEVAEFVSRFNDVVNDAQRFTFFSRAIEFQKAAINNLEALEKETAEIKRCFVIRKDNDSANFLLGLGSTASALKQELKMFVALKEERPAEAWDALIHAQQYISTALKAHGNLTYLERYACNLYEIEQLIFPPQTFFSPGFVVMKSRCSICNIDYGECDHIKGRAYMGEFCVRIIEKWEVREISVVKEPASKHARALSFSSNGVQRDIMTWRILPTDEADKPQ